jgi:lysophospholipase L1-like esterase
MGSDVEDTLPRAAHWVAAWSQGVVDLSGLGDVLEERTLRISMPITLTGTALRVRLSNAFGQQPLLIGGARIAQCGDNATALPGTERVLLFGDRQTTTIRPGATSSSDPTDLALAAGSVVMVSLYLPQTIPLTTGGFSTVPISISRVGDFAGAPGAAFTEATPHEVEPGFVAPHMTPILAGVDVLAEGRAGAIVALGDSITWDGWPQLLAERLLAAGHTHLGVVNQGLPGNRVLRDGAGPFGLALGRAGVTRFREDALEQPGVTNVLVLHGLNDLLLPGGMAPAEEEVTAREVIDGLRQYVKHAHERGVRVIGGTLTPFGDDPAWSPEREEKRQTVNAWIRHGEFDGVFDADAALRDPNGPERLLPQYDGGDHLHPNKEGLRAMAEAVDLTSFEP